MVRLLKNFLINPEIKAKRKNLPLLGFFYLMLLDLILVGLFQLFFYLTGLDMSAFYKLKVEEIEENLAVFMILAILVAPPLEELLFRYHLDYSTRKLWLAAVLFFLVFIAAFDIADPFGNSIYFLSAVFVITMLLLKELFGFTSARVLIWGSILSFGLFHVANYEAEAYSSNYFIVPLLVLPQLIGGFFLAFIRTHYGFIYCILFHACFNFVVITLGRLMTGG